MIKNKTLSISLMSALFFTIVFSATVNITSALFSYTYNYYPSNDYLTQPDYDDYFNGVVEYEFPLLDFGGSVSYDFNNADFSELLYLEYFGAVMRIGKKGLLENNKIDYISFDMEKVGIFNYGTDRSVLDYAGSRTCDATISNCFSNFIEIINGKIVKVNFPTPLEWVDLLHSENAESSFTTSNVKVGAWNDFRGDLEDGNLSDYTITMEVEYNFRKGTGSNKDYYYPFVYGSSDNAATLHETLSLITKSASQLSVLQTLGAFFKGLRTDFIGSTETVLDTSVCDSTTVYGSGSESFPNGIEYCYIFLRDSSNNKINISSKNLDFTFKIQLADGVSSEIFQRFKDNLQLQANVYFTFNSSDFNSAGLPPLILGHQDFVFNDEEQSISTEFIITSVQAQEFSESENSIDYLLYKSFYIEFVDSVREYIFFSKILPYKIVYTDAQNLSGFSQTNLDSDFQNLDLSFESTLSQNSDLTYTPSQTLFVKMFFIIIDSIPIFEFLSVLKDKLDEIDAGVYTSGGAGCIIDIPTAGLEENIAGLLSESGFKDNIRICRNTWDSGPLTPLIDAIADVLKVITGFFFGFFILFRFVSMFRPNKSE